MIISLPRWKLAAYAHSFSTIGQWKCEYLRENKHTHSSSSASTQRTHEQQYVNCELNYWVDGRLLLRYEWLYTLPSIGWLAGWLIRLSDHHHRLRCRHRHGFLCFIWCASAISDAPNGPLTLLTIIIINSYTKHRRTPHTYPAFGETERKQNAQYERFFIQSLNSFFSIAL